MALRRAHSPGQQFHLAAAVIITVNMKNKQTNKKKPCVSFRHGVSQQCLCNNNYDCQIFAHVNMPAVCLRKVNGSHVSRWGNCLLKEKLCVWIMCRAVNETAVAAKGWEMFVISLSRLGKDYLVQVTSCWLWLPTVAVITVAFGRIRQELQRFPSHLPASDMFSTKDSGRVVFP